MKISSNSKKDLKVPLLQRSCLDLEGSQWKITFHLISSNLRQFFISNYDASNFASREKPTHHNDPMILGVVRIIYFFCLFWSFAFWQLNKSFLYQLHQHVCNIWVKKLINIFLSFSKIWALFFVAIIFYFHFCFLYFRERLQQNRMNNNRLFCDTIHDLFSIVDFILVIPYFWNS